MVNTSFCMLAVKLTLVATVVDDWDCSLFSAVHESCLARFSHIKSLLYCLCERSPAISVFRANTHFIDCKKKLHDSILLISSCLSHGNLTVLSVSLESIFISLVLRDSLMIVLYLFEMLTIFRPRRWSLVQVR